MTYWPWWLGAVALSAVMLGYLASTGRMLGVSGLIARVVALRREIEFDRIRARSEADPDLHQAALLAATREQFGDENDQGPEASSRGRPKRLASSASPTRLTSDLAFLGMIIVGGALASAARGGTGIRSSLGDEFTALIGSGWRGAAALLLGGLMVGFGTRMAGGCTSGHGLAGCARLQPGSLLATLAFFAAAAVTSLALEGRGW
jgi:uncharacterized membrane protein YedE/YeeE